MKYTYRNSAITNLETIVIIENGLQILDENNKVKDQLKFHEIVSVSLVSAPTKMAWRNHQCTIRTKSHKKIQFRNYRYLGVANFEEYTHEYENFINMLNSKIYNLPIKFKKGFKKPTYIILLLFMIIGACFMSFVAWFLYVMNNNLGESIIATFGALLIWYLVFKLSVLYKPGYYNPKEEFKV